MSFRLALAAAFTFVVVSSPAQAQWEAVDEFVRAEMVRQRVPDLSVAIVRNGQLVRAQGYDSRRAGIEGLPIGHAPSWGRPPGGALDRRYRATRRSWPR